MSCDFHILYDSIIHSRQNWLPVNLIAVALVSHKYANISGMSSTSRTKRKQPRQ